MTMENAEYGTTVLEALRARVDSTDGSASRVARFLCVHTEVISGWLSGARKPRRATLERIEDYLRGAEGRTPAMVMARRATSRLGARS